MCIDQHGSIEVRSAAVLDALRVAAAADPSVEDRFNDTCIEWRIGLFLRRGRFYPVSLGTGALPTPPRQRGEEET